MNVMRRTVIVVLALGLGLSMWPATVGAQSVGDVFRSAAPSVVVIRARGRDVDASGQTRFSETGSGVLISADGKVMTASHVVHTMDEINASSKKISDIIGVIDGIAFQTCLLYTSPSPRD